MGARGIAQPPQLHPADPGARGELTASVESWAGTKDELLSIATTLFESSLLRDGSVRGRLVQADGTCWDAVTASDLTALVERVHPATLSIFRVSIDVDDGASGAVLLASQQDPGVALRVWGQDPASVAGVGHLAFRRMMAGYVDRLRGWRAVAWMLSALAPLLLIGIAFPVDAEATASVRRWLVLSAGLGSSVAVFLFMYRQLLVPAGFEILDRLPDGGWEAAKRIYQRVSSRVWIRKVVV